MVPHRQFGLHPETYRAIGPVDEKVEEPVRGDRRRDGQRARPLKTERAPRGHKGHDRPHERGAETVRVGHVVEVERIGGQLGDQPRVLETAQHEQHP
jgi:hypothetical protein